jgi:ubiquinol-cytochrome c reductase iron-sulfur subunit
MTRRERIVAMLLVLAILGAGLFIYGYVAGGDILYEGGGFFVAMASLCGAALGWAFWILPYEQVVDEVRDIPSAPFDRVAQNKELRRGLQEISRSRALGALLASALGAVGLAAIVPIRSLGPSPDKVLFHTKWRKGSKVTRADGTIVHANDLSAGEIETVFPEDAVGDQMSQVALIRTNPGLADGVDGYFAYSRVCTHAGCPVAIYRASQEQLLCPCHQSLFDVARDGAVVAGPADRPLPRLPIRIAADGTLVATGDFSAPVGPGFWERPAQGDIPQGDTRW